MTSNKDFQLNGGKNIEQRFNLMKYWHLIRTADEFLETSFRCNFNNQNEYKNYPLTVPNFVNKAFACELYIKATLYCTKKILIKGHRLDLLFLKLNEKDRKEIYHIWRFVGGEEIPDSEYTTNIFNNNIQASREVFERFRYVHEWAGSTISLRSSFQKDQMYLHSFHSNINTPKIPIYDNFLDEFAKSLKQYNNYLIKNQKENNYDRN